MSHREFASLMTAIMLKIHPGPWAEPSREVKARAFADGDFDRSWGGRLGKKVTALIAENREMLEDMREFRDHLHGLLSEMGASHRPGLEDWELKNLVHRTIRNKIGDTLEDK